MAECHHHTILPEVADMAVIDAGRYHIGIQCPAALCCVGCLRVLELK